MAFPFLEIFSIGSKILDRVLPDPKAKAEAQLELMKLAQTGELAALSADLELAKGQMEANKIEAGSSSVFVAGWRPAVGWICCVGFFYTVLLQPLLAWYSLLKNVPVPPILDTGDLMTMLGGILGLGAFRTYERIQGKVPAGR